MCCLRFLSVLGFRAKQKWHAYMIVAFVSSCCYYFPQWRPVIIVCSECLRGQTESLEVYSRCCPAALLLLLKMLSRRFEAAAATTGAISHLDFLLQDSTGSQQGCWPQWHWLLTLSVESVNLGSFSFIYMRVCCGAFANGRSFSCQSSRFLLLFKRLLSTSAPCFSFLLPFLYV